MSTSLAGLTPEQQAAALEQGAKALFSTDLGLYIGPWVLGFTFDFMLFGVMCHQVTTWLTFSKNERAFVKVLLFWAVIVATASTFFGLAVMFHLFVYHYGTYSTFLSMKLVGWYTVLDPLVVLPVQLFYTERAYRLNKNNAWIPIIGVTLALGGLAGALGGRAVVNRFTFGQLTGLRVYFWLWFGFSLACDGFITAMILFGLWRNRTGWSETDRLLNRLLRISLEAQIPCTIVALALIINSAVAPDSVLVAFWEIWHPKTYICALLAVLNARFSLRAEFVSGGVFATSKKVENTYLRSSRAGQNTIDFEAFKNDSTTFSEAQEIPATRVGINRQQPEPSDAHSNADGEHAEWDAESQRYLNGSIRA